MADIKINKKYTKPGSKSQVSKMKKEIAKFKGTKGSSAYFQWSGDTGPNGKPYKTKESPSTKAFKAKYKKP